MGCNHDSLVIEPCKATPTHLPAPTLAYVARCIPRLRRWPPWLTWLLNERLQQALSIIRLHT